MADIDNFSQIKECEYKGEHYAVRDNGAILRFPREGKRIRKDDNIWTWGVKNPNNGYMLLGNHRVHIIVATAFYGEKDSKIYIVDHIDTNRCNNRIENLRWLTRLENVLLNPITRTKITFLCGGDIMNFIKDPSCIRGLTGQDKTNYEWMRTVTPEEAQTAYNNILRWITTASPVPKNDDKNVTKDEVIIEDDITHSWIYKQQQPAVYQPTYEIADLFCKANSPDTALQMWKTPTDFLCCPTEIGENPLIEYYNKLSSGVLFSHNIFADHRVLESVLIDDNSTILVMTESLEEHPIKPYALCKIYFLGVQFIHETIKTFFTIEGAQKRFAILQGLEWTGEDSIDDYC